MVPTFEYLFQLGIGWVEAMNGRCQLGHRLIGRYLPSSHGKRLARGFTLLELLTVLGIVTIMCAMAIPLVQPLLANYQLRASVSSVTGAIQATRYQAISSGYPYRIVFSKANSTFQLASDPTASSPPVFVNVGSAVPFASGTNSTTLGTDTTLQFGGGGSLTATTGSLVLVLTRASNKTGTITVSPYGNINVVYTQ